MRTLRVLISSILLLAAAASYAVAALLFTLQEVKYGIFFIFTGIVFSAGLAVLIWTVFNIRKNGWTGFVLQLHILRQLYESGIYTTSKAGAIRYPRIIVSLNPDRSKGTVRIEKALKTQSRLDDAMSPAFGHFIVSRQYASRDDCWMIYEIVRFDYSPQITFSNLTDLENYCLPFKEKYCFAIDEDLSFPYQHVLITGQTGSGKSYALYSLIFQMLLTEAEVYFVDMKNSGIAILGAMTMPEHTAVNLSEVMTLFKRLQDVQKHRESEVKNSLLDAGSFDGDWRSVGLDPIFVVIDEYAALQALIKDSDRKTQTEFNAILTSLLLKGRSTGMFLLISMQQANASTFPTKFRDNMSAKFLLRRGLERETAVTTFGESEISNLPKTDAEPGQAFYKISGQNAEVSTCVFRKR